MSESFINSNNTFLSKINQSRFILLPLYINASYNSAQNIHVWHTSETILYATFIQQTRFNVSISSAIQYDEFNTIPEVSTLNFQINEGAIAPLSYSSGGSIRCGYRDNDLIVRFFPESDSSYGMVYGGILCCIYVGVD